MCGVCVGVRSSSDQRSLKVHDETGLTAPGKVLGGSETRGIRSMVGSLARLRKSAVRAIEPDLEIVAEEARSLHVDTLAPKPWQSCPVSWNGGTRVITVMCIVPRARHARAHAYEFALITIPPTHVTQLTQGLQLNERRLAGDLRQPRCAADPQPRRADFACNRVHDDSRNTRLNHGLCTSRADGRNEGGCWDGKDRRRFVVRFTEARIRERKRTCSN